MVGPFLHHCGTGLRAWALDVRFAAVLAPVGTVGSGVSTSTLPRDALLG